MFDSTALRCGLFSTAAWFLIASVRVVLAQDAPDRDRAWIAAERQPPMTADETRDFIARLAHYVVDHHRKQAEQSPQRGMVYEYLDVERLGESDQFVQGEALDTMHDGAWFAAAMVNAWRATGDDYYRRVLVEWQLPFYCRMLNHSDTLFSAERNDARADAHRFNREHALQPGEKGFVPYFWDDGGSVSLERRRDKNPLGPFACVDRLAGRDNPRFLLDGYSLGSSNHLAQDLGVMLQLAWLMLHAQTGGDGALLAEVADAARHLHECRMRHHGHIPMCDAPAALAAADAAMMRHVPDPQSETYWQPDNHYVRALYAYQPGARNAFPAFADDQQYRYYHGIARSGGQLSKPLALKTIYDAYTEPLLYRYYSDDAPTPAGINRFDLHPYYAVDGKPTDYRSDRKGPSNGPRPIGSREGPQNLICCGWALQALDEYPGIWEQRYRSGFSDDLRVYVHDPLPSEGSARGTEDTPWSSPIESGLLTLKLRSSRLALAAQGVCRGDSASFKIYGAAGGEGRFALVTLRRGQQATAQNDRGQSLRAHSDQKPDSEGFLFTLEIPYTVEKQQAEWLNGIEHGRYSIQFEREPPRDFYLASSERQVRARLEHELAGGLRTWDAIFRQRGYIPTGIGAGGGWERFSDSGGYAHLISAASQWLLCLAGKTDWRVHEVPP